MYIRGYKQDHRHVFKYNLLASLPERQFFYDFEELQIFKELEGWQIVI